MSDSRGREPRAGPAAPPERRLVVRGVIRAVLSATVLVTLYYLLPLDTSSTAAAVTILVIGLAFLIGMVTWQVRAIIRSPYPAVRGIQAFATSVPLFLLLFAATYFVMAKVTAGTFTQPLTRTDSLYFTVTVFSTVGFGDITAKTEVARLVVTVQMIADLVIIGLGARVILGAVKRGQQRRSDGGDGAETATESAGRVTAWPRRPRNRTLGCLASGAGIGIRDVGAAV